MGRVTRSRPHAMLRARSPDGVDAIRTWRDSHGELLGWTTGPRLVDCWFVPDEGTFLAVVDGPDEESFRPLVGSTADALGVPAAEVELHPLIDPIPTGRSGGSPPSPIRRAANHGRPAGNGSTSAPTTVPCASRSSTALRTGCITSTSTRTTRRCGYPCSSG